MKVLGRRRVWQELESRLKKMLSGRSFKNMSLTPPVSTAKLVVSFSCKDLSCVKECGFYGNPQWQGMCSKCWREHLKQQNFAANSQRLWTENFSSKNGAKTADLAESPSRSWSTFRFDKFLEKKTQQTNRRSSTLRSILKKSPSSDCAIQNVSVAAKSPRKHSKKPERQLSDESLKVKADFLTFVRTLPGPAGHMISKEVKVAMDKIFVSRSEYATIDELSEFMQDTYQSISEKLGQMTSNQMTLPCSSDDVMDEVERYVCSICYATFFCPSMDEEVADLSLQDRIRSLHWVTYGFLDSGIELEKSNVRDSFDNSVTEIVEMNSKRDPQGKLQCIVKCSTMLLEALKQSRNNQPASADEFLPALIFVILKCNPPMLQSNINFVARFALPSKLMSGETGYYFTNLCCALKFVQNLSADSLKMPRDEFEAYTSGLTTPLPTDLAGVAENGAGAAGGSGKCLEAIRGLERSLEEVKSMRLQVDRLSQDMQTAAQQQKLQLNEVVAKTRAMWSSSGTSLGTAVDPGLLDDWLGTAEGTENPALPEPLAPSMSLNEAEK